MAYPKVEIESKLTSASVKINGEEVHELCGYTISHKAGELPSVRLDVRSLHMNFSGNVDLRLPEPWASIYAGKTLRVLQGGKIDVIGEKVIED